ncbi:hypothetical protein MMC26_002940 [Xylographa opegraphella]|nr:hypothetical protein [Xylographa opegraphella]
MASRAKHAMSSLLTYFRDAVHAFTSSSASLQVLRTIPSSSTPPRAKTLYVLDSSFNPPTIAHLRLATSALSSTDSESSSKRLLLLLAIQNADKAPKPASFEHRLVMMTLFAEDLLRSLPTQNVNTGSIAVDIAITKHPYFIDKSKAITASGIYQPDPSKSGEAPIEQVHLIGFDTFIRLLNSKYYPPSHTLTPLQDMFEHNRLRVTYRGDDEWGDREEQDAYLKDLRDGKREHEGGKREWANSIEMVEGKKAGEKVVSSTKVRKAAQDGDADSLKELCTESVANYVLEEKLYVD